MSELSIPTPTLGPYLCPACGEGVLVAVVVDEPDVGDEDEFVDPEFADYEFGEDDEEDEPVNQVWRCPKC